MELKSIQYFYTFTQSRVLAQKGAMCQPVGIFLTKTSLVDYSEEQQVVKYKMDVHIC